VDGFITTLFADSYLNLGRFLGQQHRIDAGKNSALRDGDVLEDLAKFLIVEDGQLKVARADGLLLVVPGSIAGQLQDLGAQVLEDSSHVDSSTLPNAAGVASLLHLLKDPRNREHDTGLLCSAHTFFQSPGLPGFSQKSLELHSTLLEFCGSDGHLVLSCELSQ
jgi:hypothetical protein